MNKTLVSIAIFSLSLIMAQQCPAQITYTPRYSEISIRGDSGDNTVTISQLGYGYFKVELLRGNGAWETRIIFRGAARTYIDCDLGEGSNYYSNTTSFDSRIDVAGNGNNTILCGDGDDLFFAQGSSRDVVLGGHGDDILAPGDGADWVFGEEGDDYVFESDLQIQHAGGDGEVDGLFGGEGRDIFVLGTEDIASDLEPGELVFGR